MEICGDCVIERFVKAKLGNSYEDTAIKEIKRLRNEAEGDDWTCKCPECPTEIYASDFDWSN